MSVNYGRTYFFESTILRGGVHIKREGGLSCLNVSEAIEQIKDMADMVWNCPLLKTVIYEVDKNGQLGERLATINHVLSARGGAYKAAKQPVSSPLPQPSWKEEQEKQLWNHGTVFRCQTTFNTILPKEYD